MMIIIFLVLVYCITIPNVLSQWYADTVWAVNEGGHACIAVHRVAHARIPLFGISQLLITITK